MRRISITTTADRLYIQQQRAAQVADAAANFVVAGFLIMACWPFYLAAKSASHAPAIYLAFLPSILFAILGLRNLYRMIKPLKIVIDRKNGELITSSRRTYPITEVASLNISYTGFKSPARYTLIAALSTGASIPIESSGYFGSRQELHELSSLIADFTKRIDLYAR